MPDTKITALTAIGVVDAALDPLPIVDTSDTSMAASGTTKKISINQILGAGGAGSFSTLAASGAATLSSTLGVTGATTLTGALTANGNVTLGNALSDVITVTGSLTARDGELASSIRAAASDYAGVAFDGATSGTRVVSGSQAIGTGPFSVWSRFKVPASVPASGNGTNPGIWGLSDSNNATYRDNAVVSYLDSSNGLNLFRYGANKATDFRLARISNFVNTYAGQVVDIVITRSENTLKIYINGTDTDYTETTGGTPPAWGNTIVSDFLIVGAQSSVNVFGSSIYRSVLFNRALSAADVVDLIELGVDPADQWGTQTQIVNTTTLNGGFETAGAGGADVFANWVEYATGTATITRDTVDYSPDLGSTASAKYVGTDGTAVFSLYNSSAVNLLAGKRYRISSAHKRSANANIAWRTTDGNVALVTFAVTTSWANYVGEFVMPTNDSVKIDGSGANSLWIDNVILERIGAIVDLDFTVGLGDQAYDRSTNSLHGTLIGGVSWTVPREEPVPFIDGTMSLPSITNAGDTNTGLYFPAADTIAATTNGVERIRVDSAGQVGIGKTPTLGLLDVNGDAYFNTVRVGLGGGGVATSTVVGNGAMAATATGHSNTAIGAVALAAVTGGINNTAVGRFALNSVQSGSSNTAVGSSALTANTASDNTAVGFSALNANTSGTNNVAVGRSALAANTTTSQSTAVGRSALALSTAADNTALGWQAGDVLTTGASNTIIGSGADASAATGTGQIVIGKGVTGTANNRITVGINANIAELDLDGADTSWAASSDERLKKNIQNLGAGLSFVTSLRPVSFQWRSKREVPVELANLHADSDEPVHGDAAKVYHGFIAQEVKASIDAHPEVVSGQHFWESREDGVQTLAPADLVPVLVNCIKELNARLSALENK